MRSAEVGMNGKPDEDQLEFATLEGRVIYTRNTRDFRQLHVRYQAAGSSHAGLIFRARDMPLGEQIRRISRIWSTRSADDMRNSWEFLSQWGENRPV